MGQQFSKNTDYFDDNSDAPNINKSSQTTNRKGSSKQGADIKKTDEIRMLLKPSLLVQEIIKLLHQGLPKEGEKLNICSALEYYLKEFQKHVVKPTSFDMGFQTALKAKINFAPNSEDVLHLYYLENITALYSLVQLACKLGLKNFENLNQEIKKIFNLDDLNDSKREKLYVYPFAARSEYDRSSGRKVFYWEFEKFWIALKTELLNNQKELSSLFESLVEKASLVNPLDVLKESKIESLHRHRRCPKSSVYLAITEDSLQKYFEILRPSLQKVSEEEKLQKSRYFTFFCCLRAKKYEKVPKFLKQTIAEYDVPWLPEVMRS